MANPLIGVTTSPDKSPLGLPTSALPTQYVSAIHQAGGLPVLVPLGISEESALSLLGRLDGVVFSGGGDVDPEIFAGLPHPRVMNVSPERDRLEMVLVRRAVEHNVPFLGICRGIQVINVALGGKLYTHIEDQLPGALKHDYFPGWERNYLAHPLKVEPNSRLASILGSEEVMVNSLHHQGLSEFASSLRPVAWAPDGLIEAVELPDHPFGLGVQWHPEWLLEHAPERALFRAFVRACGG